ncbi:MarR family winged helix-turn-helix transcriptional regulator [Rathayibacter soli]|uniref:MarR family winged helix-turn-helix transcriptional regulator n=1 Tax=Rathayibacter soli TaxID=3144168 RepID=UPI0027E4C130|nr:MarR family winged helix-turn-helix transcriptional regulator [Glaciibacter superstes]
MTERPTNDANLSDAWSLTLIITRLRRTLRASIRSEYSWESLPMAQVEILQGLAARPGQRVNELAERHRLAKNTVSTLIQQMVLADLVVRSADTHDRRAVRLSVSAHGLSVLEDWLHSHERRFGAALDRLGAADRRSVLGALPALSRLVDELEASEDQSVARPAPN